MILKELIDQFHQRAGDRAIPPLFSPEIVQAWLNEAVDEACLRARLLFDADSPLCTIPIVQDQAIYQLDPSVYEIVDAWMVSASPDTPLNGHPLQGVSQSMMDQARMSPRRFTSYASFRYYPTSLTEWLGGNWRQWKGVPLYYIQDQTRIQLVPIPTTVAEDYPWNLQLNVFRTPIDAERMDTPEDEPIIPQHWHHRLIDWALFRAYSTFDFDRYDLQKAALAEAEFEKSFGKRRDANSDRKIQQRTRRTVASVWP